MPAQKSLHMWPRKLTFAKSHALSSNLTLAPRLHQEKRKQKTTLSPGALQRQRSGVSAVKEWGEGFGLDPRMSSEFPRLPLAALHNAHGQLHTPAPRFVGSLRHLPLCLHPHPNPGEKSDSSSQMQISPEEPSLMCDQQATGKPHSNSLLQSQHGCCLGLGDQNGTIKCQPCGGAMPG